MIRVRWTLLESNMFYANYLSEGLWKGTISRRTGRRSVGLSSEGKSDPVDHLVWERAELRLCRDRLWCVRLAHAHPSPFSNDRYLSFIRIVQEQAVASTNRVSSLRRLPPLVFWSIPFPNVTTPHNRPFKSTARLRRNLNCIRSKQISNTKSVSHVFASLIRPRFVPVRDGEF